MNALLKLGLIASLLAASTGVGYYYAVHLPRQDAELDNARVLEATLSYAQKRAAQERALAQQREWQQRQAAKKAVAETRYQSCLDGANAAREASWTAACKRLAEKAVEDHAGCLTKSKLSQGYCDAAYRMRDASPNCVLPVAVATDLDGGLTMARRRCLQEREAALQ
jgi:hypothetical protein